MWVRRRRVAIAKARNMTKDDREPHVFVMQLRYVRIHWVAASMGSVRCCTSARSAKRKSC